MYLFRYPQPPKKGVMDSMDLTMNKDVWRMDPKELPSLELPSRRNNKLGNSLCLDATDISEASRRMEGIGREWNSKKNTIDL